MSGRISIMVVSGSLEKLQMAAMVASIGAVSGNDVRVFFSMNALPFLLRHAAKPPAPEGPVGELLIAKRAPPFADLFRQAVDLGDAKLYPCSMAMDILALKQDDLEPYVGEPMGLTRFLDDAAEGQVWSF
jgi:peroxiredoxin family protein